MNNSWSKEEENLLAQVWVAVSQNVEIHNENSFWNNFVQNFNNQTVGVLRNKHMVTGKWKKTRLRM